MLFFEVPTMSQDPQPDGFAIERYRDHLLWVARHYLNGLPQLRIDPSDAVHETLLRAHKNLGRCRAQTEAQRFAWLRTILHNLLNDCLRQGKHEPALLNSLIQNLDMSSTCLDALLAANHTTPAEAAMRHERILRLADAMRQLPEASRIAVEMRYLQDPPCSLAEIALHLGRTEKAAAGLVARGLAHLRQLLKGADA
jgi:RNA polymerase sigma-70 factor (ECF subfamily)